MLRILRNLNVNHARNLSVLLKNVTQENPFKADDYVPKYDRRGEFCATPRKLFSILKQKYAVDEEDYKQLFSDYSNNRSSVSFSSTLDILYHNRFTKSTIVENPWLLYMDAKQLQKKIDVLYTMKFQDINDFTAFLRLPLIKLEKLVKHLREEANVLSCDNRVYYISDKLKVKPKVLTQFLSKRLFMLQMPLDFLNANLNNMITYGVDSMNVLKDLWAFKYTPNCVKSRLERAKMANKDKLMPWMVRCPEKILERSLKLSIDEKELLGEHNNVVEYIAQRLGFTVEMTDAILKKHPATFRVRAPKVKEVLDYLLDEAGYSPHDIACAPRILCHGLETTKERLEKLKSMGCKPTSLTIVCRSKNEFEKFVRKWDGNSNYFNRR